MKNGARHADQTCVRMHATADVLIARVTVEVCQQHRFRDFECEGFEYIPHEHGPDGDGGHESVQQQAG